MNVDAVLAAERIRLGEPDPVSGAFGRLAMTQGTLLKEEYDHGTHFFAEGALFGAAIVDTVGLIHLNMQYGFKAVDGALKAQVEAMRRVCPRAKIVRIHGDAFAIVLGPTADQRIEASLPETLRAVLDEATRAALSHSEPVRFHVALLELKVKDPPNFDTLGPLLWGECERALVLATRGQTEILQRRVDFNATV